MAVKDYSMNVESLVSIFVPSSDTIKVLLMRKEKEPYKGYWVLPGDMVKVDETIEDNIANVIYEKLGLKSIYIEQDHIYSNLDRSIDNRVVAVNYIGLIDQVTLLLKREENENIETEWFSVDNLPKLGYDHSEILERTLNVLSNKLTNINYVKNLFPSDFSLPEIEKVLSSVLKLKLDRRNFRKRLLKLDIIEETGEYSEGGSGRPAKLYRFKDNVKDINII